MAKKKKTPSKTKPKKTATKAAPKVPSKLTAKSAEGLLKDIWPEERDLFIRPERLKYVRQIIKPEGCVFCEAVNSPNPAEKFILYKSKNAMVILNKYPYNNGHILILPTEHQGNLEDLSDEVYNEIQKLLKRSIGILKKVYRPGGLNVGLNLGAAAGAGIPDHLHYHVVPRWFGDTNFFPLLAQTKLVVETLETTFSNLEGHFQALEAEFQKSKGRL